MLCYFVLHHDISKGNNELSYAFMYLPDNLSVIKISLSERPGYSG